MMPTDDPLPAWIEARRPRPFTRRYAITLAEWDEVRQQAVAIARARGYDAQQVLNTPHVAVPRAVSGFFVSHRFAPMGDAPVREAGGPSTCGCSTSPHPCLEQHGTESRM